ncbi:hypothetical protein TrLO_g2094 [Triparma laevis f. longispina]|uniref:Uncharacterized protein n=1 Tax=Triparma laevis f. longispina TaxID=1714387 RepID=A0A9W7FL20_9STRA|nr:hypothetical protein TrLO_g2094 [Triparma laevis f. longispina]
MKQRLFLEGKDDVMKQEVFNARASYWMPIRDDIESWVREEWERFEEEKPEWFTDHWKELVRDYMIPGKGGSFRESGGEAEAEAELAVLRRRSTKGKRGSKVVPAGVDGGEKDATVFNEEKFKRQMKRKGSMSL